MRNLKNRILPVVISVFLISGCAKKVYVLKEGFNIENEQTKNIEVMYFYDGFGMSEEIKAYKLCPNGIGGVEYDKSLLDSLIAIITANIITPRRVTFYCIAENYYTNEKI